jgi:hypothetical protein
MSGVLDNSSADALGSAIASALNGSSPDTAHWQTICRLIYSHLKTDVTITIAASEIVTNGGPSTQSGPPAPINHNPN